MFHISPDPIQVEQHFTNDRAGALVTFEGRVRNLNEGREVQALEYESFIPLAEKEGARILKEAQEKFAIIDARCVHRVGQLQIGDIAIRTEVLAAHRAAAFEACEYIVDEVKSRVPIWKKEHYVEGDSGWINCAL